MFRVSKLNGGFYGLYEEDKLQAFGAICELEDKIVITPMQSGGAGRELLCRKLLDLAAQTPGKDVIILSTDDYWLQFGFVSDGERMAMRSDDIKLAGNCKKA